VLVLRKCSLFIHKLAAMKIEVTLLHTNEFVPEELIGQEIPMKYLINDGNELTGTSTILNSEKEVTQLINFLFHGSISLAEMHRDNNDYIIDLSSLRPQRIDYSYLEEFFPKWIEETRRANNMDEFGILLDFLGHINHSLEKRYLLLIVTPGTEHILRILVNGNRPDFRIFSVFLWGGGHSVDSDGDSYNPASRSWTWLHMSSRVISGEYFEINQISEQPLIFEVRSPNESIANRVALFLARESTGHIIGIDGSLQPYESLIDKLGHSFDLPKAFERADQSIWRQSTLEKPYPNLK
jgi:hypothetical protein